MCTYHVAVHVGKGSNSSNGVGNGAAGDGVEDAQ